MKINGVIIPVEQVFKKLEDTVTNFVEKLEERNGMIVAVVKRNLIFDQTVHGMHYALRNAGYDQFLLRINPDRTVIIVDGIQLEQDLAKWVDKEGGRASEAAEKIKTAFYGNLPSLDLCGLSLRTLPEPILRPLTNLRRLNISKNKLTALELPSTYTNLETLYVSENKLTALKLPGTYTNLKMLDVHNNQLTALELPDTYKNLKNLYVSNNQLTALELPDTYKNLRILFVSKNKLEALALPRTYTKLKTLAVSCNMLEALYVSNNKLEDLELPGTYMKLRVLDVHNNKLTVLVLPDTYTNLRNLYVSGNPNLCTLPLWLSESYNLNSITTEGTSISEDLANQIRAPYLAMRNAEAHQTLPHRLRLWSAAAKNQFDFSFIENFSQEKIRSLSEWLRRLEHTKDCNNSNQSGLALLVCRMLSSLNTDSEFKEEFFARVDVNLEDCDDRVAMSLNEIFVAWKLRSLLNSQLEDKEQLNLMIAAAKTLTLLKEIANKCVGRPGQAESVEIYLYYTLALREKLNLLTAIYDMRYPEIGMREWINEKELEGYVNANYLEALCDLPIFKAMAEKDSSCGPRLKEAAEKSTERMEELERETKKEGEYIEQMNSSKFEYESNQKQILQEWARERIARM